MPKLGAVPPAPEPVDPFKNRPAPTIGVVQSQEISVQPPDTSGPKLGVVTKRPTQVVDIPEKAPEGIGVVAPAVTPAPAPPPQAPPVGIAKDEIPVYPPPPPEAKPNLGTIVDLSITPPKPPEDEMVGEVPAVSQPNVVDPFKKDE